MTLTIKWISQSCFQIRTPQLCVYTDPAFIDDAARLPKADLIVVTHHHPDHIKKRVVAELSGDGTIVVGTEKARGKLGSRRTIVKPGDSVEVKGVKINVVDAYNPPGSHLITMHRKGACVGYVLEIDGKRVYHAGDTGLIDEMKELGPVDVALLPIGGTFTMDIDEAVEAVKVIRPGITIPMHMRKADPLEFKRKAEAGGNKVVVLAPGGEFSP